MAHFLDKGQKSPLKHTVSGNQRVTVGISWDAREGGVALIDGLIGKDSQHDLDISCFLYDHEGDFLDYVSAEARHAIDESGTVYHSGDNRTGEGDGDDETIAAELANLPDDIQSLIYVVEIGSNHVFGDVLNITARIFDSKSRQELLKTNLDEEEGKNTATFVFAAIHRDPGSETGWTLHYIGDYPDLSEINSWGEHLKRYLA